MQQRKQRKRTVAIALGLIAAAGLVAACFGNEWLATPGYGETARMDLRSFERCDDGECKSQTNFELVDAINAEIERIKKENEARAARDQHPLPTSPWGGFPIVGMITLVCGLLAAAGLAIGAFLALASKRIAWPIMPTTLAVLGLAIGIINACLFVATKPELQLLMGVGWSFWVFGGAAVVGLASVFPLNRQIRPIDEELGAASATMSWGGSRDDLP